MRLIVFQKMVTSRWHRKYFSYDVELLISEEKIKYLSMNIPLDVLCSLGSLLSHYMFTFKLFLTSLAKNLEAFSCASSIILSCLSTSLFITSNPLSTTASCILGFFKTVAAKAGRDRLEPVVFPD